MENKETLYQGGFINTWLLDAVAIQANIINAGYINTLALDASIIQTGQLSADRIDVTDLVVKSLRTETSGQRIEILAANNNMVFYDADGVETFRLDDNVDSSQSGSPLGGIRMRQPNGRVAYATGNGFFSNGGGMLFLPGSSGIATNASIVGILFNRNPDVNGISAAIVGRDGTTSADGLSKSYAGFFIGDVSIEGNLINNGNISTSGDITVAGKSIANGNIYLGKAQFHSKIAAITNSSYDCTADDYHVVIDATTNTVTLPAINPATDNGRRIRISNLKSTSITINRQSATYSIRNGASSVSSVTMNSGETNELVFCSLKGYWVLCRSI